MTYNIYGYVIETCFSPDQNFNFPKWRKHWNHKVYETFSDAKLAIKHIYTDDENSDRYYKFRIKELFEIS